MPPLHSFFISLDYEVSHPEWDILNIKIFLYNSDMSNWLFLIFLIIETYNKKSIQITQDLLEGQKYVWSSLWEFFNYF